MSRNKATVKIRHSSNWTERIPDLQEAFVGAREWAQRAEATASALESKAFSDSDMVAFSERLFDVPTITTQAVAAPPQAAPVDPGNLMLLARAGARRARAVQGKVNG